MGYDYALSGESWPNASHITYSIAPDGVYWDHGVNNLSSIFDAKFGAGTWQRQLARAFATWQSFANINITPTSDGYYEQNTVGQAQGDSRFGDIRVGGYGFTSTTTLAQTYFPPPNGSTAAGDLEVNTAANFNINSAYDVYSVLLHEIGHSLGLKHVSNSVDVMYGQYQNVRSGLAAGDIAGIQAIYGARTPDTYQSVGVGLGFSSAIDLSSAMTTTSNLVFSGISLPKIGSSEYFTVVAPSYASGSLQFTASSTNVSMLSPKISLYSQSGTLLAQSSNPGTWANSVTVSAANVVAGQRYYVVVSGATGDYFDTGAYTLNVSLPNVSAPSQPGSPGWPTTPSTPSPNAPITSPLSLPNPDRFEPNNSSAHSTSLGTVTQITVQGLNLDTSTDVDYFKLRAAKTDTYVISAAGTSIRLLDPRGRVLAGGTDQLIFNARRGLNYQVVVSSASNSIVSNYNLSIGVARANPAARTTQRAWRLVSARLTTSPQATAALSTSESAVNRGIVQSTVGSSRSARALPWRSTNIATRTLARPLPLVLRRSFVNQATATGQGLGSV